MAFLDGPPPTRLCQPMADHMLARGGELRMEQRISEILLNDDKTVRSPSRHPLLQILALLLVLAMRCRKRARYLVVKYSSLFDTE